MLVLLAALVLGRVELEGLQSTVNIVSTWDCSIVTQNDVGRSGSGIVYTQYNCTGYGTDERW